MGKAGWISRFVDWLEYEELVKYGDEDETR
jgi:hypothetical protein